VTARLARLARHLALAFASTLLALGTVEVGLRAVGFTERVGRERIGAWRWTRYDPVLGHGNVPGFAVPELEVTINTLGFRGGELARRKRPGVVRIFCLGDSTTFGIWRQSAREMRANAPYPAALERLARADGYDVEVVNAGVLGQTTNDGIVQLLTQILPLEPDVITLRFGNNDHAQALLNDVTPLATRWEYPIVHALPGLAWRSEALRFVFHAYRGYVARHRPYPALRVPIGQFEENLHRFVTIARERDVRLAFVDFPYREIERGLSPDETLPNALQPARTLSELHASHDRYQAVVARVAARTGTPLVRTLDAMRTAAEPTFTDYDLSHPNAAGYGVIARRLYEDLRGLGWLGPPPDSH
jgi:lysophospholipase L1-like esterase